MKRSEMLIKALCVGAPKSPRGGLPHRTKPINQ